MAHIPVMVKQVVDNLDLSNGDTVIDATAGLGGHAFELARIVGEKGTVLAIDRDGKEVDTLCEKVVKNDLCGNVIVINSNYAEMDVICSEEDIENVSGVLFDLGFSSWHIEESGRGFSFSKNEPLDMRYDPEDTSVISAYDIVNSYPRHDLANILYEYGEEKGAEKIAKEITNSRKKEKIETTGDLVQIVSGVVKARPGMNPATKVFQALRIVANNEIDSLEKGLESALSVVKSKGRIVVISFHSLEDRVVKEKFKHWNKNSLGEILTKKVITPHYSEVKENRRARSAKMRVFCKE